MLTSLREIIGTHFTNEGPTVQGWRTVLASRGSQRLRSNSKVFPSPLYAASPFIVCHRIECYSKHVFHIRPPPLAAVTPLSLMASSQWKWINMFHAGPTAFLCIGQSPGIAADTHAWYIRLHWACVTDQLIQCNVVFLNLLESGKRFVVGIPGESLRWGDCCHTHVCVWFSL